MATKKQLLTETQENNPKPQYKTINGEQIELTDEEYEQNLAAFVEMRYEQQQKETELIAKQDARQAVLDKLGLTADEAAALFG